ncbi:MAG TPA: arylsulfatase [Pirellulales bacterium]|nr:arylsulfatase [Pirellulales bacterium]
MNLGSLKRRLRLALCLAVIANAWARSASAAPADEEAQPAKPNIVLIMSDDMGFSDLGCYGGEIHTPNLDRLAGGGLRFTQFYNTGRCCPTRASLLTGLYPHQAGVGHMMQDRGQDGYRGDLNEHCVTIAQVLKAAGYGTYMTGKWHVTKRCGPAGPKDNWPRQRGFDRFYGTLQGAGSYYDPAMLVRDNTMISSATDELYRPKQYYYTDAITDHAVRFLNEHQAEHGDRPFFLYVAYTAAHWPLHALEADVAKYHGKYDQGYEPRRRERFERLKQAGLISPTWRLSPQAGDWHAVENKRWEARCMEVYAAMIERMDQGIGRIVDHLAETGRLENTLVMFLQDNGGCAEAIGRGTLDAPQSSDRADRPSLPPVPPDALQLAIAPAQTREGFPMRQGVGVMPGPRDTYLSYGRGWANVSNTPFREYKHWVHEGGISTPLIVHWGGRLTRGGELEHQPAHLIDIMATCVAVSGADYPKELSGHKILPREGLSLVPAFEGQPLERDALYWEHEGNRAMRQGQWKLVAKGRRGAWELYDMEADRTELDNLAAREPERVAEMASQWETWGRRTHVLPWPEK